MENLQRTTGFGEETYGQVDSSADKILASHSKNQVLIADQSELSLGVPQKDQHPEVDERAFNSDHSLERCDNKGTHDDNRTTDGIKLNEDLS